MNGDRQLEERLRRLCWPVDRGDGWAGIEARTRKAGDRARTYRARRRRLRVALGVSTAIVLLAGAAVGTVFAVEHFRQQPSILVIDDGAGIRPGAAATQPQEGEASGGQWERLPVNLEGDFVYSLDLDPSNSSILYAVGEMGVYKTVNGAASWELVLSLDPGSYTQPSIVVDPLSPSTLYLVTETIDHGGWSGPPAPPVKIVRSDDGGKNWTDLGGADPYAATWPVHGMDQNGCVLYCDASTTPSTLYLTNPYGQPRDYWRSTDRGQTWAKLDKAEQDLASRTLKPSVSELLDFRWREIEDASGSVVAWISCAVTDPDDPSVVYGGTDVGVCKSTNGGKTWTKTSAGMTHPVGGRLVFDPSSPSVLYVAGHEGIFKSRDGGATWKMILPAGYIFNGNRMCSLVMAPSAPSTLYAWTADGLFRTDDGGETWSANTSKPMVPSGFAGIGNGLLMVVPDNPNILFAVNDDGLIRSDNGGKTWKVIFKRPYLPMFNASLAADPNDPSAMYAVTQRSPQDLQFNVMKSVDKGATWTSVVEDRGDTPMFYIALDANDPAAIYTIGEAGGDGELTASVSRSLDGGSSWQEVDFSGLTGYPEQLLFDPRSPDTAYALTMHHDEGYSYSTYKVFRSTDGGARWQFLADADVIAQTGRIGFIRELTIDPNSGTLYGEGSLGVYKWAPGD